MGLGHYGLYRSFNAPMGIVGYIFSILILIYLFVCTLLPAVLPTVYGNYLWFYAYYTPAVIFYVGGLVLLGITEIIFGMTMIFLRNEIGLPELCLVDGIILITAGSFIASYYGSIIGFVLLFISGIIDTVIFLRAKV